MKIGICDSGLGGLIIAQAIQKHMPDYDYIYLGDTLHLPYGQRSQKVVYDLTLNMIKFLFSKDCKLVILACNTACAIALRKIQQEFLPKYYPDRNVLGVIDPMLEEVQDSGVKKISVIGTEGLIRTNIYGERLAESLNLSIGAHATPLLVPLLENDGLFLIPETIRHYDQQFDLSNNDGLILGCTHYAHLKKALQEHLKAPLRLFSQDDIIPKKLHSYLERHTNFKESISKNSTMEFYVSDYTNRYQAAANELCHQEITLQEVSL